MAFYFNNFNFINCFLRPDIAAFAAATNCWNPFMDSAGFLPLNQNINFQFSCPANLNLNGFKQGSIFGFNPVNYQIPTPSFNNTFNSGSVLKPSSTSKYKYAPDRKQITVDDVDYSVMGAYASQIKLLRPEMQRKVEKMFIYAQEQGWKMTITSGYRSTKKQAALYDKWIKGEYDVPVVAAPGTSRHEFGCAVDISITCKGKNSDNLAKEMGKYGESIGLRWGGSWSKNKENWHFDLDPKKTPDA